MIPAILYYFVKMMSIKTVKFLRYFITQNQKLPSTLAGEVASLSQKAHPEPQEKGQVLFFQILPQLLLFLQVFLCPGFDGQDRTMVIMISRYCIM